MTDYTLAMQMHDVHFFTKKIIPHSGEVFRGNTFTDIVDGMKIHNPFTSSKSRRMYAKGVLKDIEIKDCELPYDEDAACEIFCKRLVEAGYAAYVVRDGEICPPWQWDKRTREPVLKIRKKRVVKNLTEKYSAAARRNLVKSHEARRTNPELAREIATKASMASLAKSSPEDHKRRLALARAAKLLKAHNMTPEEREEARRKHSEAMRRAYETRRRKAALRASEAQVLDGESQSE